MRLAKRSLRTGLVLLAMLIQVAFVVNVAAEPLQINEFRNSADYSKGRVTSFKSENGTANGGPVTVKLQIASATPYPKDGVVEIEATLAVESGYYKMEYLLKGQPSLVLEAGPNKPAQGKGKVGVTPDGQHVECRMTAKAAKKVRYAGKIAALK